MLNLKKYNNTHLYSIAVLFLFSLFFLYSSPISKGNGWVDTNAMLEIGKSWFNGFIPYKDVFEQRGPLFFFYYLIANVISQKGFLGLFVIEVLNLFGIYFLAYKILEKFNKNRVLSSIYSLSIPLLMVSNRSFEMGGSPEEFITFWIFLAILSMFRILNAEKLKINSFLIGLSVSAVFWIKYTSIGFVFGVVFISIAFLIYKRKYIELFNFFLYSFLGFAFVSSIWFIYFISVGGLNSFIDTYFFVNLNAYAVHMTIKQRLLIFVITIKSLIKERFMVFGFYTLATIILFIKDKILFFISALIVGFMLFITYIVGQTRNYSFLSIASVMILFIFASLLVIAKQSVFIKKIIIFLPIIPIIVQFLVYSPFTRSVPYIFTDRPFTQKDFGDYILSKSNKKQSFIYYNMIDAGVERFFNSKQPTHYFEQTNVPNDKLPAQGEMLKDIVLNRKADFVIMRLNSINTYQSDTSLAAITKVLPKEITDNYKAVKYGYFYYPINLTNNEYQLVLLEKLES